MEVVDCYVDCVVGGDVDVFVGYFGEEVDLFWGNYVGW